MPSGFKTWRNANGQHQFRRILALYSARDPTVYKEITMGLRLPGQESANFFFVTTSFHDRQLLGNHPIVYPELGAFLANRLSITKSRLVGFVFMPSHIHLILDIEGSLLSEFMRDFKKFTAQKSLSQFAINGRLWQERYDRFALNNYKILSTKLNYIHQNPVKAGLADSPISWYWSSARDYVSEESGPLSIWKEWAWLPNRQVTATLKTRRNAKWA